MLMFKEEEWVEVYKFRFKSSKNWRANRSDDWEGTLVITVQKVSFQLKYLRYIL